MNVRRTLCHRGKAFLSLRASVDQVRGLPEKVFSLGWPTGFHVVTLAAAFAPREAAGGLALWTMATCLGRPAARLRLLVQGPSKRGSAPNVILAPTNTRAPR